MGETTMRWFGALCGLIIAACFVSFGEAIVDGDSIRPPLKLQESLPKDGQVLTTDEARREMFFRFNHALDPTSLSHVTISAHDVICPLTVCGSVTMDEGNQVIKWTPHLTGGSSDYAENYAHVTITFGQNSLSSRVRSADKEDYLDVLVIKYEVLDNEHRPLEIVDQYPEDGADLTRAESYKVFFEFNKPILRSSIKHITATVLLDNGDSYNCNLDICGTYVLSEGDTKLMWDPSSQNHKFVEGNTRYTLSLGGNTLSTKVQATDYSTLEQTVVKYTIAAYTEKGRLSVIESEPSNEDEVQAEEIEEMVMKVRFNTPVMVDAASEISINFDAYYQGKKVPVHCVWSECGDASVSTDGTVVEWRPPEDDLKNYTVPGRDYTITVTNQINALGDVHNTAITTNIKYTVIGSTVVVKDHFPKSDGDVISVEEAEDIWVLFTEAIDQSSLKNAYIKSGPERCALDLCGSIGVSEGGKRLAWSPAPHLDIYTTPGRTFSIHWGDHANPLREAVTLKKVKEVAYTYHVDTTSGPFNLVQSYPENGAILTPAQAKQSFAFLFSKALDVSSLRHLLIIKREDDLISECPVTSAVCGEYQVKYDESYVKWIPKSDFFEPGKEYSISLGGFRNEPGLIVSEYGISLSKVLLNFRISVDAPEKVTTKEIEDGAVVISVARLSSVVQFDKIRHDFRKALGHIFKTEPEKIIVVTRWQRGGGGVHIKFVVRTDAADVLKRDEVLTELAKEPGMVAQGLGFPGAGAELYSVDELHGTAVPTATDDKSSSGLPGYVIGVIVGVVVMVGIIAGALLVVKYKKAKQDQDFEASNRASGSAMELMGNSLHSVGNPSSYSFN